MTPTERIERILAEFDSAWRAGKTPSIPVFLQQAPEEAPDKSSVPHLLLELIAIDLEYRWRLSADGKKLESYLANFPELRVLEPSLLVELLAEEFRVRARWQQTPTLQEYQLRFPAQAVALAARIPTVQGELLAEFPPSSTTAGRSPTSVFRTFPLVDPRAPLATADFLIQRHLGSGAVGRVYRARQISLDRTVALKFLRKSFLCDPPSVERFLAEARTVASLRHPGIVSVQGLGRAPGGGYFIVMDYIPGGDLRTRIERGPVSIRDAVHWVRAAARAIEYSHQRGIIHCDLKPSNLLLTSDGQIVIADFGLARRAAAASAGWNSLAGTPAFMAPEQVDPCWGEINRQTDVFGLGAILYSLLTGHAPYQERRAVDALAAAVASRPIPSPKIERPEIPADLTAICNGCLAKQPAERLETAGELVELLSQPQFSESGWI